MTDAMTSTPPSPSPENPVTIIMYHYVRDLAHSRYPRIKGLSTDRFERQLDHIAANYTVCSLGDLLAACRDGHPPPRNACLLTFDDGFADHFTTVFPRLLARGFTGSFFPPARAILEHSLLDVHKIHCILACTTDSAALAGEMLQLLAPFRRQFPHIAPDAKLREEFAVANRFDNADIIFVKRLLQKGLPEPVREAIADELLLRHVGVAPTVLSRELYMDLPQLQCMANAGMEIGGHGWNHLWLNSLTPEQQHQEITATADFLRLVYRRIPTDWTMSYPSGGYNQTTISLLQKAGCSLALTTQVGLVTRPDRPYELPRLDTNDLPS
jgi:peptidoglycan/xylan/chitin deacetylase (PgdA/CDA1 family)